MSFHGTSGVKTLSPIAYRWYCAPCQIDGGSLGGYPFVTAEACAMAYSQHVEADRGGPQFKPGDRVRIGGSSRFAGVVGVVHRVNFHTFGEHEINQLVIDGDDRTHEYGDWTGLVVEAAICQKIDTRTADLVRILTEAGMTPAQLQN